MQLYIGIGMIAVGIMTAVLGFAGVVPHIGGSGIALAVVGAIVIGLSFVPNPQFEEEVEAPMPLYSRLINIFISPGEVFKNIRYHPTWLGVVVVIAVISGVYNFAFFERMGPETISNYTVDKIAESGFVPAEQVAKVRQDSAEQAKSIPARVVGVFSALLGQTVLVAFIGVVFFLVALVMGGKMNFLQALSVAAFSLFPVVLIQKAFSLLILFLKDPVEIHPIIGQGSLLPDNLGFLITAGDSPVLYSVLSYMGLLGFYWLWLNAVGIKTAGTRVSPTAGWVGAAIVWGIGLSVTVLSSLFFGKFLG